MQEHKLSDLQYDELRIFKEFVKLCEEQDLRYFLVGGSFLGAVRHKGFIPWDDDIDVAMPRPDFERFEQVCSELLPDWLYLSTYKNDEEHITLVAQIFSKEKKFLLNNAEKQVPTAAWVDILIIDGAPEPGLGRKIFGIRYMYYRMLNQFAVFDKAVNLNKKRPWYENMAIKFAQATHIQKMLNPVKAGNKFHKFLKKNSYDDSKYVATFMGAAKMNEILPKEVYGEGTDCEYEGMIVKGPDMGDEYLTHFYGDYMMPPPMDQRNRHNVTMIKNTSGGANIT